MRNREGYWVSETERECTKCGVRFPKTSKTVTLCNSCNSTRVKSETPEIRMYRRAKTRAREKGLVFNIEVDDVIIPSTCPVFGVEMTAHSGHSGGRRYSPSLDRIDNARGYEKGNIMVISHQANMMKSSASMKDLVSFAHWVLATYGNSAEEVTNFGEHK